MTERERALYDEAQRLPGIEPSIFGADPEWRLLRTYEPTSDDGRPAKVWVLRAPAQFYRLTSGDVEITTGSGPTMGILMCDLARAVADGMVGFAGSRRSEARA